MSRALWFAAGAATGVYGLVKARRTAQAFTPDGVGARVAGWRAGARVFGDEVRAGMAERETELRDQLRLDAVETRQIEDTPTEPTRTERAGAERAGAERAGAERASAERHRAESKPDGDR